MRYFFIILAAIILTACAPSVDQGVPSENLDKAEGGTYSERPVPHVGAGRYIQISTPKGDFNVWTKKVGDNPTIKVLLLHGGPGMTHEIYEVFGRHFP